MQESISIFSEMQKIIYEFPKLKQTATVQCYNEQLVWKKEKKIFSKKTAADFCNMGMNVFKI